MRLADLRLALQYRSNEQIIARDFYDRCLPAASSFRRAVGFFATTCFSAAPEAYEQFFKQGGYMQLVCCPIFSHIDVELFRSAFLDRRSVLKSSTLNKISFQPGRLGLSVKWLLAAGKLELRIAVLLQNPDRIYHEKIGVFDDGHDQIAFTGSANETTSGLRENFEVIDVFRSWESSEQLRVRRKIADFSNLWLDESDGLKIFTFPQASTQGFIRAVPSHGEQTEAQEETARAPIQIPASEFRGLEETLYPPADLILFPHQKRAVRSWFEASGRGIYEMATGSGKTIAALTTAAAVFSSRESSLFLLIVCPYLHLVAQWSDVAKEFGLDPILCAQGKSRWEEDLSLAIYNLSVGSRQLVSAVTSNATFISAPFQRLIEQVPGDAMIVADEVHNLGAPAIRRCFPNQFQFRLGLSATPERWFDEEGTAAIVEYFGKPVVRYTIEDALKDGVLCPYSYHPVLVTLSEAESERYFELSMRIARECATADDLERGEKSDILDALLIKRARLVATAENKIAALRSLMRSRAETSYNLVYCGDGTVDTVPDEAVLRQMDVVTRLLGLDLNMKVARYVAETPLLRREKLRRDFAEGRVQCLVAIRCLDEGVDIPETRRAFILASSSNPRQFIQRRGRVLRRAPGKDKAEIYDFIVTPPDEYSDQTHFNVDRQLFKKELTRVATFARSAVNGPEALGRLLPLRERFNLLDVF